MVATCPLWIIGVLLAGFVLFLGETVDSRYGIFLLPFLFGMYIAPLLGMTYVWFGRTYVPNVTVLVLGVISNACFFWIAFSYFGRSEYWLMGEAVLSTVVQKAYFLKSRPDIS
jgi:hypothetical protein